MTGDLHFALVDTGPIFPAIKGGKVQLLTLTVPKPSAVAPAGKEFKGYVPGIPGAEVPLEVVG